MKNTLKLHRCCLLGLVLAGGLVACGRSESPELYVAAAGCTTSPAAEESLHAAQTPSEFDYPSAAYWQERVAEAREVRERQPHDLKAQFAAVFFVTTRGRGLAVEGGPAAQAFRTELEQEYELLARRHPRDPALPFLLGQLADDRATQQALYREALELDPAFAWAHYALVMTLPGMVMDPVTRPELREELRPHAEEFLAACPARTGEALAVLERIDEPELWAEHAERLGRAVQAELDEGTVQNLDSYWQLAFRYAPLEEHEALRAQVEEQVAAVRRLDRPSDRDWLRALERGYPLTGDAAGADWVDAQWIDLHACTRTGAERRIAQYREDHPEPGGNSEPQALEAWRKELLGAMQPWLEQCPDNQVLWSTRLATLNQLETPEADDLLHTVDRVIALTGDGGGDLQTIVRLYIDRRVRLAQVPSLLDRLADQLEALRDTRERYLRADDDAFTAEFVRRAAQNNRAHVEYLELQNRLLRIRWQIATRDLEGARTALATLDTAPEAAELRPGRTTAGRDVGRVRGVGADEQSEAPSSRQSGYLALSREAYWQAAAELATAAGRPEEALEHYRQALQGGVGLEHYRQALQAELVLERSTSGRQALTAKVRDAWVVANGDADAFEAWLDQTRRTARVVSGEEETVQVVRRPLPEFTYTDLSGREWTLEDLRGKSVLLNFWATWCAPCVKELPHLKALHDRLRDDARHLVLAVNVDANPGLVAPFLKQRELEGLPVLMAGDRAMADNGFTSIPQNWILDREAQVVREHSGFGGDGAAWTAKIERSLEEAWSGAPAESGT